MARFFKDNGLTIVLVLLFASSITGHLIAGWHVENEDVVRHGGRAVSLVDYATGAAFMSSVFENWESEFLQMGTYVVLTAFLVQRGSAESNDPDSPRRDDDLAAQASKPGAPRALSRGAAVRWIYAHSLSLVLFAMFVLSFVAHWTQSAREAAQEALEHGETALGAWAYLGDAQLWFESFQNWQSEFLSTAVLVVLSIFLRQRGSSQSKPVAAPNSQTGE